MRQPGKQRRRQSEYTPRDGWSPAAGQRGTLRVSGSGRRPLWSPFPHQSTLWRSPPPFQGAWSSCGVRRGFMSQKVFIGGLPFTTSTEELGQLFNQVEGVESVEVVTDRDTGQSRGFGFAHMATSEAADQAVRT